MNITFSDTVPAGKGIRHYAANQQPLTASPLCKLPLGAVRSQGWLKHQLDLMEDGLTGHLNENGIFLTESNGWLHPETVHAHQRREKEPVYAEIAWKEQAYWLRAAYPLSVLTGSTHMQRVLQRYTNAILSSVQPDGWFGPQCLKDPEGTGIPDLWPHMVALDYLRDCSEYTHDRRILSLMAGFFRFCTSIPEGKLMPDPTTDACSHWQMRIQSKRAGDMLPHIYWLYNHTGDQMLLALAARIYRDTGRCGKAITATVTAYTLRRSSPTPLSTTSQQATRTIWPAPAAGTATIWMTSASCPGGAIAADEMARPGKTDARQGFETCAMAELGRSYLLLSCVDGDLCESVMLNSYPASHTADMKAVHYLTCVNPPEIDQQRRDHHNPERMLEYMTGDMYRCCLYNGGMGWPTYAQRLIMAAQRRCTLPPRLR